MAKSTKLVPPAPPGPAKATDPQQLDPSSRCNPAREIDMELLDLVHRLGAELAGLDNRKIHQVLDALKVLFPTHVVAKPSNNGVGYMP